MLGQSVKRWCFDVVKFAKIILKYTHLLCKRRFSAGILNATLCHKLIKRRISLFLLYNTYTGSSTLISLQLFRRPSSTSSLPISHEQIKQFTEIRFCFKSAFVANDAIIVLRQNRFAVQSARPLLGILHHRLASMSWIRPSQKLLPFTSYV